MDRLVALAQEAQDLPTVRVAQAHRTDRRWASVSAGPDRDEGTAAIR